MASSDRSTMDRFVLWLRSLAARLRLFFPIAAVLLCATMMVLPGAVAGPVSDQDDGDEEGETAAIEASAGADASTEASEGSISVGWHQAPAFMAPLYLQNPDGYPGNKAQ